MDDDDWFTLTELSGRIGALVWVEEQLGEVLAGWAAVDSHAPSTVLFSAAGQHHLWHGSILRECLPTSPRVLASGLVAPPSSGWVSSIATLRALTDPDATAARLKAIVKVVDPWLEREIDALLDVSRPISDAATMRWLRFVALDHDDDGQAMRELLAARSDDAVRFDDHVAVSRLELS